MAAGVLGEVTVWQLHHLVGRGVGDTHVPGGIDRHPRIIRAWAITGEHHAGVIFSFPRRYHRGSSSYPANLVTAVEDLMAQPPSQDLDWVYWLP